MLNTAIDLARLPAPTVLEPLAFEQLLEQLTEEFKKRYPQFTATLESEPVMKLLQVFAYRELLLRARINDGAKAVMLAYAQGSDLDHIAANVGVFRQCLDPGDLDALPPRAAVYESDVSLRERTQLAPEGWATTGCVAAYIVHARGAHPQVKDVSVYSPEPGIVQVTILSNVGHGAASDDIINVVYNALNHDEVRPLTDCVQVQSADIVTFELKAELVLYTGPSATVVLQEAQQRLETYLAQSHKLHRRVNRSGIFAALHGEGVERVDLKSPKHDIKTTMAQAPYCKKITLTYTLATGD